MFNFLGVPPRNCLYGIRDINHDYLYDKIFSAELRGLIQRNTRAHIFQLSYSYKNVQESK